MLRQAHTDDLSVYGLTPRQAPGAMPPGRAVVLPAAVEVQVALLGDDPAALVLERLVRAARDGAALVIAAGTTEDLLVARYRG